MIQFGNSLEAWITSRWRIDGKPLARFPRLSSSVGPHIMKDMEQFYGEFKEHEAFDYASNYYNVLSQGNPYWNKSIDIIGETAEHYFREALELQVAGLCLVAGKPKNAILLPVSFAFFVVDHLTMGWSALMASHFRVAYSMSRGAVEGAIFELASAIEPDSFSNLWLSKRGTGGAVLRSLKKCIPKDSYDILVNVLMRVGPS